MKKKPYQQPQTTKVRVGLNSNIMDDGIIISSTLTETQFSRYHNKLWDDEEEDGDW